MPHDTYPQVYCRYGKEKERLHRVPIDAPFPEDCSQQLRKQLKLFFAETEQNDDISTHQTSVFFYLGEDGVHSLAGAIRVFSDAVDPGFSQNNLRIHLEQAWKTARQQLGLTT